MYAAYAVQAAAWDMGGAGVLLEESIARHARSAWREWCGGGGKGGGKKEGGRRGSQLPMSGKSPDDAAVPGSRAGRIWGLGGGGGV